MFEHTFTKNVISQETIMDPFRMLLDASLFQIMDQVVFFLFSSFPISVAMRSSLIDLRVLELTEGPMYVQ